MTGYVQVPAFELPRTVYDALARLAKARGTTVTDVLHGEAVLLSREVERSEAIIERIERGESVRDVAAELDMTNTAVRARMTSLGLRSNRT